MATVSNELCLGFRKHADYVLSLGVPCMIPVGTVLIQRLRLAELSAHDWSLDLLPSSRKAQQPNVWSPYGGGAHQEILPR